MNQISLIRVQFKKGGKYNEHYGSYIAYSNSEWEKSNIEFSAALKLNSKHPAISAPSYDMVLDWLLEHFGYCICVANISKGKFCWQTTSWCVEEGLCHTDGKEYSSRYKAMDAAFKSILKARIENKDNEVIKRLLEEIQDGKNL